MTDREGEELRAADRAQETKPDPTGEAKAAEEPAVVATDTEVAFAEQETDETQAQVLAARAEAEDYRDRWLRAAAELENLRRRTAREYAEQTMRASERVLRQILEPVDNLERAIRAARQENGPTDDTSGVLAGLLQGIEMVYGQCMALLERENVRPMESVGKPFDASIHDAIMTVERADQPPNTVVEEVERGYWLGDRVLRHAKVVVSKAPPERQAEDERTPEAGEQ